MLNTSILFNENIFYLNSMLLITVEYQYIGNKRKAKYISRVKIHLSIIWFDFVNHKQITTLWLATDGQRTECNNNTHLYIIFNISLNFICQAWWNIDYIMFWYLISIKTHKLHTNNFGSIYIPNVIDNSVHNLSWQIYVLFFYKTHIYGDKIQLLK